MRMEPGILGLVFMTCSMATTKASLVQLSLNKVDPVLLVLNVQNPLSKIWLEMECIISTLSLSGFQFKSFRKMYS